jgi:hypothetical protein
LDAPPGEVTHWTAVVMAQVNEIWSTEV